MTYKNRHQWMSEALRTEIKLKNSKHKETLKSKSQATLDEYKVLKRDLHSSLRNSEISYFSDQIDLHEFDMGKTWKVLRTVLNLNNPSSEKSVNILYQQ